MLGVGLPHSCGLPQELYLDAPRLDWTASMQTVFFNNVKHAMQISIFLEKLQAIAVQVVAIIVMAFK